MHGTTVKKKEIFTKQHNANIILHMRI